MESQLKSLRKGKSDSLEHEVKQLSYDIVGDIGILRLKKASRQEALSLAEALMQRHKNVRTVLRQVGAVSGDFRLRRLAWVKGERKHETLYKEHGCIFKVDLKNCYFSPRLSHERLRLATLVKPDETIVNMFAGVGSFSVMMAKLGGANTVLSIDVSPIAFKLMQMNARLNRVEYRVVPILGDSKNVIRQRLRDVADRAIMPLPTKAYDYLDHAAMALKPSGGWIHYYDFVHASKTENPVEKVKVRVEEKLQKLDLGFEVSFGRVVRSTGPNWHQVVLDIFVAEK